MAVGTLDRASVFLDEQQDAQPLSKAIVGFDSAWVDNPKSPGAVCAIRIEAGQRTSFVEPRLASFRDALAFVRCLHAESGLCLVALDQPTIVPNQTGCRPVDRVAGSLISWLGGGVQPANRSKAGMFDDAAPVWAFKEQLGAIENPEQARSAYQGLFLIEVFPALALPSLECAYFGRKLGPRYNPARGKTFKAEHWQGVLAAVMRFILAEGIEDADAWISHSVELVRPRKSDQDKLDAVLCALVGYQWLMKPRSDSIMIGDLERGYMIAPASSDVRARLDVAAAAKRVPVDGRLSVSGTP